MVKARGDIEELKTNLDSARLDRQHKEEYEALRRLCMQYPSRATTEAANAQLAGPSIYTTRIGLTGRPDRGKHAIFCSPVVNDDTDELRHIDAAVGSKWP